MATGNPVIYTDFSGGLNLEAGPYLLKDNECQDARDVSANREGSLTKRNGSRQISEYEDGSAEPQLGSAHSLFATSGAFDGFIGVGLTWWATRSNLCTNPNFETDTGSGWFTSGGTKAQSTDFAFVGTNSLKLTATSAGVLVAYGAVAAQANQAYTFSAYVRPVQSGRNMRLIAAFVDDDFNSTGLVSSDITASVPTGTWTRLSMTATAPPGTTQVGWYVDPDTDNISASGDITYLDAVLLEPTDELRRYFDGSGYFNTADAWTTSPAATEWTGTAHASVSRGIQEDAIANITISGVTTTLKTGLTANTQWEWVQGPLTTDEAPNEEGPYYGMNGVDTPQYWDGVSATTENWTATTGIIPPTAPYLIYHLDKFWASGCVNCQGRIWSTGLSGASTPLPDPGNWDTDFIDDVDPDDGQDITGLGKVGPYLLVFKARKSYVLSDPAGRAYRSLSSSIGCASHRSIVETAQGTLFLSEDLGVCITDGTNIRVVSDKIQPLLEEIAHSNPVALRRATATYLHDSYWLSVPYLDTKNTITLQYQLDTGAWWIHSFAAADFATLDVSGRKRVHSALPGVAGMNEILVDDVYSDNEVPYESYWEGPFWTWGAPHLNKRVNQYRIDGAGEWSVDAATTFGDIRENLDYIDWELGPTVEGNFGEGENFGGVGVFGTDAAAVKQRRYYTPTNGWGRAWSLKLYDPDNVNLWAIYSVTGFLRPRSD
jgi:hypothetical protein